MCFELWNTPQKIKFKFLTKNPKISKSVIFKSIHLNLDSKKTLGKVFLYLFIFMTLISYSENHFGANFLNDSQYQQSTSSNLL